MNKITWINELPNNLISLFSNQNMLIHFLLFSQLWNRFWDKRAMIIYETWVIDTSIILFLALLACVPFKHVVKIGLHNMGFPHQCFQLEIDFTSKRPHARSKQIIWILINCIPSENAWSKYISTKHTQENSIMIIHLMLNRGCNSITCSYVISFLVAFLQHKQTILTSLCNVTIREIKFGFSSFKHQMWVSVTYSAFFIDRLTR